jgi:hypothetical protein
MEKFGSGLKILARVPTAHKKKIKCKFEISLRSLSDFIPNKLVKIKKGSQEDLCALLRSHVKRMRGIFEGLSRHNGRTALTKSLLDWSFNEDLLIYIPIQERTFQVLTKMHLSPSLCF